MPLAMAIGGVVAWRQARRGNEPVGAGSRNGPWRDSSLDDWRQERDEALDLERQERLANAVSQERTATGKDETSEKKRHQRMGG